MRSPINRISGDLTPLFLRISDFFFVGSKIISIFAAQNINRFIETSEYNISRAIVFSNERNVFTDKSITYMPIYYCMFLEHPAESTEEVILDEIEPVCYPG